MEKPGRGDRIILRFGDCELDEGRYQLRRGGVPCHLEPQVFEVLAYLVRNRGRVVTKAELLDEIWGSRFVSESALTSRVKAARRAVGDSGREQRVIRTVHGRGYEFLAPVRFLPPVQPQAGSPAPAGAAAGAGAVDSGGHAASGSATLPLRGAEPGAGPVQVAPERRGSGPPRQVRAWGPRTPAPPALAGRGTELERLTGLLGWPRPARRRWRS
jgi:DNA-binding winged helix-turn-helix (wHTH) protein